MPDRQFETPVSQERRALPIGTRIQEFEILRVVGGGGFGIVYLARDHFLERHVALKEYMPPMASRAKGTTPVIVKFGPDSAAFSAGLGKFLNEARLLARFDHPALVKVHRFWEENGTAYMAMPFYLGDTLRKVVAEKSVPDDENSLRQILSPLLDAVAALHGERCYHRDISPDNIVLTPSGPVLLDFGAARRAIGDASHNFTAVLKEGYAPLEQYGAPATTGMNRQGPWTDIYALAGVIRFIITGRRPAAAVVRVASRFDPLEPLARIAAGRYSDSFLRAIDAGMALQLESRPQSIAEFRALLEGEPDSSDPPIAPKSTGRIAEMVPGVLTGYVIVFVVLGLGATAYLSLTSGLPQLPPQQLPPPAAPDPTAPAQPPAASSAPDSAQPPQQSADADSASASSAPSESAGSTSASSQSLSPNPR